MVVANKTGPSTPLEFARIGSTPCFFKREDLNETGSHKDRAAKHQLQIYKDQGVKALVLSSSGNGAKATAAAAKKHEIPVYAFLSPRTPRSKVEDILVHGGRAIVSAKPLNLAKYIARQFKVPNLRPSTCPHAVEGFQSLGREIGEALKTGSDFDSIFTFASSGTSLVALSNELKQLEQRPSLHAVQAGDLCPLVEDDDDDWRRGQAPRTGSLCAKKTARAPVIREYFRSFGGRGWIVTDAEVDEATLQLKESQRFVSREAAAAFCAARRAFELKAVQRPLVILTGKALRDPEPCGADLPGTVVLNDYLECKAYFEKEAQTWK